MKCHLPKELFLLCNEPRQCISIYIQRWGTEQNFTQCLSTIWETPSKQYRSHYNFSLSKKTPINVNTIQDTKHTNKIYWSHTLYLRNVLCYTDVWRLLIMAFYSKALYYFKAAKPSFSTEILEVLTTIHIVFEKTMSDINNTVCDYKHILSLWHRWPVPANTRHNNIFKISFITSNYFFCYQFKVQISSVEEVLSLQQQLK